MKQSGYLVVVTGTDPQSQSGGIGFALPGYLAALDSGKIKYETVPTFWPQRFAGRWWPWLRALPNIVVRAWRARAGSYPLIIYSHPGAGASLLRETILLWLARCAGARTIMQLHCNSVSMARYLGSRWKAPLLKLALRNPGSLCVLTPWWRELLQHHGLDRDIHVIPNPLPPEWQRQADRQRAYPLVTDRFEILCMTRLEKGKGVELVLEAMAFLPADMCLIVAGDGGELSALRQRAQALGIVDRVQFSGWVSGVEKQRLLDRAHLYCLPTTHDSFGMALVEAMANGLPVVVRDWGPIRDVVPHERAGLLVDSVEPEFLAATIEKFRDRSLRQTMGRQGQKWVVEQFGAHKVGHKLRLLMDELVSR